MRRVARERGRTFDIVGTDLPLRGWSDLRRPIRGVRARSTLTGAGGEQVVTIPIVPPGADLRSCAKGDYRRHWVGLAGALTRAGSRPAYVELTADSAGEALLRPTEFAACYRSVATTLREKIPGLRLQWRVQRGGSGGDSARAWPGRGYVDVIGIDALDTGMDWSHTVNGHHGLNWWADFATRHGVKVALARWGAYPGSPSSVANAAYVQNVTEWMARTARQGVFAYDLYTQSPGAAGAAAETYRKLFAR